MKNAVDLCGLESVFIPAKDPINQRLLLVMHGLGDSVDGYRFLPKLLEIPSLSYLLVNAPDSYFTGYSWFDLFGDRQKGIDRSRKLLFEALDEIHAAGWKSEEVGLFGFSQGCLMAMEVACNYPEVFGCVVGISGFLHGMERFPEGLSPVARKQQILLTHGTEDPMLPIEETKRQANALIGMGMRIQWKTYRKEHTIDPRHEVEDIRDFIRKHLFR
jgi:phospholipase/carboxylesterase